MEEKVCERCRETFGCEASSPGNCWCFDVQIPKAVKDKMREQYGDCLCADCLQTLTELERKNLGRPQSYTSVPDQLVQEEHYYYSPEGYMVFTEKYLLQRGYCCNNGCRHCPYGFNKKVTA